MTIGEKIQFYRKQIGLSQEALGQKLLVSRQTVSLWEMDKTLPTIDNLLRLKEIFSVSIDDILSESNPAEEQSETPERKPKETYIFQYKKSELKEISKKAKISLIKRAVLATLSFIFLFFFFATTANDIVLGLFSGVFLIVIIWHIKSYFVYSKIWKNNVDRIPQNIYSCEIFDGYFVLNISRNGELTRTQKIVFEDIEKIYFFDSYLFLEFAGQNFFLNKNWLSEDSVLFSLYKNSVKRKTGETPKNRLETVSNLLIAFSIASIFLGNVAAGLLWLFSERLMITDTLWILFLLLPIPIASVIFGFYLKKNGYKYKPNVVIGIIMTIILCIVGSNFSRVSNHASHSDQPILKAEEMMGIDIPIHSHINTQDWTKATQHNLRGYVYSTSDIYFESQSVEEFERNLPNDPKWLSSIPNGLVGIISTECEISSSDYYIIYNTDTGEFNKTPEKSGTYRFINLLYDTEKNTMKIVEYQIEYND